MYNLAGKVDRLQQKYDELSQKYGLEKRLIYEMDGVDREYPVWGYVSRVTGPAVWVASGIHGEETAGPMAIAKGIELIGQMAQRIPMVVMPLLNPVGMVRNWRYFNESRDHKMGSSVGDMSHVMVNLQSGKRWAEEPANRYAAALARMCTDLAAIYPPRVVFDHHEDEMAIGSYVYPLGDRQSVDVARKLVERMSQFTKAADKLETRFGEKIEAGIVIAEASSSFDDLVIQNLGAKGAWTIETPTGLEIERRIQAHTAVMKRYEEIFGDYRG